MGPTHAGEDRVIDTIEIPPITNGVVTLIAFDEAMPRLHDERFEGE